MRVINIVLLLGITIFNLRAETSIYESTDNTGLNKKERIDAIEGYLKSLSQSVKKLEDKLNENDKKFKSFDEVAKILQNKVDQMTVRKVGEIVDEKSKQRNPELEKLKVELDNLKSKDIEKLKNDITDLKEIINSAQYSIRK